MEEHQATEHMPTTLPRVHVTFERNTYEVLDQFSKVEQTSLSDVVKRLVNYAIELTEDLALVQLAEERLKTFRRDDALTTEQMLRWNRERKKK